MDRDIAVLIGGGYQFSDRVDCYPDMGIEWTELIDASPEVFLERIEELEKFLEEFEPYDFVGNIVIRPNSIRLDRSCQLLSRYFYSLQI